MASCCPAGGGKQYEHQKKRHGAEIGGRGNQHTKNLVSGKNYHLAKSEEVVAKEHGLSPKTVRNYEQYAKAVDTITENLGNETKEKNIIRGPQDK